MFFRTTLSAAAACLAFSNAAKANVEYDCGYYANSVYSVTYFDEEDVAEIRLINGAGQTASAIMRPIPSGSGSRYRSPTGNSEFVEHQGNGYLFILGHQLNCTLVAVTAPGDGFGGGNQQGGAPFGRSFGGNLRSGPGMGFADVGSTFNGQQLTLLQDTGVYMNGYSWWIVQLQNGQQAHQWGGLLCAPGQTLSGLYNQGC